LEQALYTQALVLVVRDPLVVERLELEEFVVGVVVMLMGALQPLVVV
jgi:hypothetical protein